MVAVREDDDVLAVTVTLIVWVEEPDEGETVNQAALLLTVKFVVAVTSNVFDSAEDEKLIEVVVTKTGARS